MSNLNKICFLHINSFCSVFLLLLSNVSLCLFTDIFISLLMFSIILTEYDSVGQRDAVQALAGLHIDGGDDKQMTKTKKQQRSFTLHMTRIIINLIIGFMWLVYHIWSGFSLKRFGKEKRSYSVFVSLLWRLIRATVEREQHSSKVSPKTQKCWDYSQKCSEKRNFLRIVKKSFLLKLFLRNFW